MTTRQHLRAWAAHAALNLGAALGCLYHIVLPPQVDHDPETVESLSRAGVRASFWRGLR